MPEKATELLIDVVEVLNRFLQENPKYEAEIVDGQVVVSTAKANRKRKANKPQIRLTDKVVEALPLPEDGNTRICYYDAVTPGLGLQVLSSGTKTWLFRVKGGQGVGRKIGRFPEMKAKQARAIASENIKMLS